MPPRSFGPRRASVDVVLVRRPDGENDLLPDTSASCRTCGMCGITKKNSKSTAHGVPMRLSLPVRALIVLALGVYGLPLIGLLAGALLATAFGAGDAAALLGALIGCAIAIIGMRSSAGALESAALGQLSLEDRHYEFDENTEAL